MARLNTERQEKLEPTRILNAKESIEAFGYEVYEGGKALTFIFKNEQVTFFPYSGWATGKSIKDGRCLQKLLTQINPLNQSTNH